ncbi:hypothetical protein [Nostoc sp. TCL26-01]|uniref:hypothetical protein n=1 Tax=Nostoc sp. TCL26-01 TaxID=2576904 RepID=UPI0015BCCA58|nr:hypothetical protein [Nostoc sp. TCL26-01]QLE55433.1 hypothetical protein FD725_07835 [Nostoc sp. TCL26-01]
MGKLRFIITFINTFLLVNNNVFWRRAIAILLCSFLSFNLTSCYSFLGQYEVANATTATANQIDLTGTWIIRKPWTKVDSRGCIAQNPPGVLGDFTDEFKVTQKGKQFQFAPEMLGNGVTLKGSIDGQKIKFVYTTSTGGVHEAVGTISADGNTVISKALCKTSKGIATTREQFTWTRKSNPLDLRVLCYYIYSLFIIFVFIRKCYHRNWKFVRATLLYYLFITFFAFLLIYGSAYNLESHLDQLQKQGLFSAFPFTISGDRADINTISRTNPDYLLWTISLISFFATFPQAVARGARIYPHNTPSPDHIMNQRVESYNNIAERLNKTGKILLPFINDFYIVGEWVFVLVALSSFVSPFPMHSWYLILLGCFFILIITGSDITNGIETIGKKSPLTNILKEVAPGIISKLRDFSVLVLQLSILLVSVGISIFSGFILFSIIANIMHTKNLGTVATIIIFVAQIGVFWFSCTYLSKSMEFVLDKLIDWMGYRSNQ